MTETGLLLANPVFQKRTRLKNISFTIGRVNVSCS